MTQYDFGTIVPSTTDGTELASIINSFRDAINSNQSGTVAPTYRVAGMLWVDTTTVTAWALKLYDGVDWMTIATFNTTTNVVSIPTGVLAVTQAVTINNTTIATTAFVRTLTTGLNEQFIPAVDFIAPALNPAALATRYLTTNLQPLQTYAFDQTTQEFLWYRWVPPKRWSLGTVTFAPIWTAEGVPTGTAIFTLAGVTVSNDDPLDAVLGTGISSTDTFVLANDLHVGPTSTAITIAGVPADGDVVWFRLSRDVATDTLTADAQLIGIKLFYTTDTAIDT